MRTRRQGKPGRLRIGLLIAAVCLPALRTQSDEPAKAEKPAADSMVGKEEGDVRDDNGLKMKLVWCPPGFFEMGGPQMPFGVTPVRVFLTRGYWLGKCEVTQAEWKEAMTTEPWKGPPWVEDGGDFPAQGISWEDAMAFCRKFTQQERKAGRLPEEWEYTLPTEAQWERACRARSETKFSFGDDEANLGEYAWYCRNTLHEAYAHRVGQKKPNPWGICDMYGNVWEWCRDYYSGILPGGRDPEVTGTEPFHVVRGGDRNRDADSCRSGHRNRKNSKDRDDGGFFGFRVALTPVQPAK